MYIVFIYLYDRPSLNRNCAGSGKGLSRSSLTLLLSYSLFLSLYLYVYIYLCSCSAYTDNIIRIRNFHLKAFSFNEIKTYVRIACMYIMYVCVSVCVYIINKTVVGEQTNRNEMI